MFNILVSYAAILQKQFKPEHLEELLNSPDRYRVFIDSGAFTNNTLKEQGKQELVTLDSYTQWLKDNGDKVWKYINLDVVGDPITSRENYQKLKKEGLHPTPVITTGTSAEEGKALIEENGFACIGGINIGLANMGKSLKRLQSFNKAEMPFDKTHMLGVSRYPWIARFKPFSVDSSTWFLTAVYGRIVFFDPTTPNKLVIRKREHFKSCLTDIKRLGFNINDFSKFGGTKPVGVWNCVQYLRYADYLQRKHGVNNFFAIYNSNPYWKIFKQATEIFEQYYVKG